MLFHTREHNSLKDANCENPTSLTYVDDINCTIKAQNNVPLQTTMHKKLDICKQYMSNNQLALNKPKTKIFAITDNTNTAQSLYINGENVDETIKSKNNINIQGIKVTGNMKLNEHIMKGKYSLVNQLTCRINALKRLVKVSDMKFSINLANGLFMSKL